MNNKKGGMGAVLIALLVIFGVTVLLGLIILGWIAGTYNGLVKLDTSTSESWGKVQSAYERRLDLLPNLARTVKGSADFEQKTLIEVAKARGGIRVANNPTDMDTANKPVVSMMAGMMTYVEQYPNIKSTEAFKGLMDELAGTENRIKWERDNYNEQVKNYQIGVRVFPANMIAGMFNFQVDKWEMFKSNENASSAPEISFN